MAGEYLGLIGVVVGAGITGGKEVLFDWRNRRRNARYLAIRTVCLLDQFIDNCASVAADDGTSQGEPAGKDGCYEPQVMAPEFEISSLDGDWKTVPQDLMYALISFPMQVEAANHRISVTAEHSFPPFDDFVEERQLQYAKLGLKAAALADRLRRLYKIPPRTLEDWNPIDYMRAQLNKLEQRRRAVAAQPNTLIDLELLDTRSLG